MTTTQIQVPEELLQELRSFAKQHEWTLTETFRRGAELLLQVYPQSSSRTFAEWTPPTSSRAGWQGLSPEELREAVMQDSEPQLP